jgi:hypothetical protein
VDTDETFQILKCTKAKAEALFAPNGFDKATALRVRIHRHAPAGTTRPLEKMRAVVKSKAVVVGIFNTDADVAKTKASLEDQNRKGATTVTCDPSREVTMDARIKVASDSSRFLLYPASGLDCNWFATFHVGKDGKVQLIGDSVCRPAFENSQPFKDIHTSGKLQDIIAMQDNSANQSFSPAISLNTDTQNKRADYVPITEYLEDFVESGGSKSSKADTSKKKTIISDRSSCCQHGPNYRNGFAKRWHRGGTFGTKRGCWI